MSLWKIFLGSKEVVGDATIDGTLHVDDHLSLHDLAAAPTNEANHVQLWADTSGNLNMVDASGDNSVIGGTGVSQYKSYSMRSPTGSSGDFYMAGYIDSQAADINLNQGSLVHTLGEADAPHAAHAFYVAGGTATGSGGSGVDRKIVMTVTGVSITDAGVRNGSDSEIISSDLENEATDTYIETSKKWLSAPVMTLSVVGVDPYTSFSDDFNAGLIKYDDFGNRDFKLTDVEFVGLGGATDSGFDIQILHHSTSNWTYSAAAFAEQNTALISMGTDHSTDNDLSSGEQFAWKRAGLSTAVDGNDGEGIIIKVTTGANNSITFMDGHIGVQFT